MKKVCFFIIMFLFCPYLVNADLKVINHLIDAELEIAGGLKVRELIIVEGITDFFSRNINYKNTKSNWDKKTINFKESPIYNGFSIENVKISGFKVDGEVDFNTITNNLNYFSELNPQKLKDDVYTYINNELGSTYNLYHQLKGERYAYYLEYVISNVVVVHEDVHEVNYTFKNLDLGAASTTLRVVIPYATNSKNYQLWVHGPKSTTLKELVASNHEKIGFQAQFENLKMDVNFRMTLPKEQVSITLYLNHSKVEALKAIQKQEQAKIKQMNISEQAVKIIKWVLISLGFTYIFGALILFKFKQTSLFIMYLVLGILIMLFNYLFKYNIIYLYFVIIVPLLIKGISKLKTLSK